MHCFKKKFPVIELTVSFCSFLLIASDSDNHDILPHGYEDLHPCKLKYDKVFVHDEDEKCGSHSLNKHHMEEARLLLAVAKRDWVA